MTQIAPLAQPDPPLADDRILLEPLRQEHRSDLLELVGDEDVRRYTLVPSAADEVFVSGWITRYENGWRDASCAGFAIVVDSAVVGFGALVQLEREAGEAELGYLVGRAARGRGAATSAVALLTTWAFDELGLERLELRIDPSNTVSERVAERNGYRLEGVLRSKHFKEGLRADIGVWSRLRTDIT